jgi:hypothetical protein
MGGREAVAADLVLGSSGLGLQGKGISLVAVMILALRPMCRSATAKAEKDVVSSEIDMPIP